MRENRGSFLREANEGFGLESKLRLLLLPLVKESRAIVRLLENVAS